MTPAEASAPYIVAAAGPFTISIDSMSSGSMSFSRSYDWPPVKNCGEPWAVTRTPSTYSSGSLLSEIDDAPRTRICVDAPDEPEAAVTETHGMRDCRSLATVGVG